MNVFNYAPEVKEDEMEMPAAPKLSYSKSEQMARRRKQNENMFEGKMWSKPDVITLDNPIGKILEANLH